MKCACGSKLEFADCCQPIIEGKMKATTPEALMRSRYTAFTLADIDYIEASTDPSARKGFDRDGTTHWAKQSEWLGLEIIATSGGEEGETEGEVEFVARYKVEEQECRHHERGQFKKRDGQWFFLDGKIVQKPVRAEEKAGRNEPCPCGSGKKFKKCHGLVA